MTKNLKSLSKPTGSLNLVDWLLLANGELESFRRSSPKKKKSKPRRAHSIAQVNPKDAPVRGGCLVPWGGAMPSGRTEDE